MEFVRGMFYNRVAAQAGGSRPASHGPDRYRPGETVWGWRAEDARWPCKKSGNTTNAAPAYSLAA